MTSIHRYPADSCNTNTSRPKRLCPGGKTVDHYLTIVVEHNTDASKAFTWKLSMGVHACLRPSDLKWRKRPFGSLSLTRRFLPVRVYSVEREPE